MKTKKKHLTDESPCKPHSTLSEKQKSSSTPTLLVTVDISNSISTSEVELPPPVLTFGLDKASFNRLTHDERTCLLFSQFLASTALEDVSNYALRLLTTSGCCRLPSGPFSDDSITMADLRVALRTLGFKFKPKLFLPYPSPYCYSRRISARAT